MTKTFYCFQGDGDSAPDTPPPEFADSTVDSKFTNGTKFPLSSSNYSPSKKKKEAKSGSHLGASSQSSFNFSLDAFSCILFFISFVTRVWKLETPRSVV